MDPRGSAPRPPNEFSAAAFVMDPRWSAIRPPNEFSAAALVMDTRWSAIRPPNEFSAAALVMNPRGAHSVPQTNSVQQLNKLCAQSTHAHHVYYKIMAGP